MIELEDGLIYVDKPEREKVIKKELGGRWKKKRQAWELPAISLNVLKLVEYYGDEILDGAPEEVVDLATEEWGFRGFTDNELTYAQHHPSWDTLYNFQREGVEYYFCNPHGAGLLGLSPGLGKTAVATIAADLLDLEQILVLAPLTLAKEWTGQIERWSDRPRDIKRATADDRAPLARGVTIANHEVIQEVVQRDEDGEVFQPDWATNARAVRDWINDGPHAENEKGKLKPVRERITRIHRDYLDTPWQLIIADESVLLKNRRAVKTNVLMTLRKACDAFLWELSGSPTTKFRDDLHRQLELMFPRAFTSYWRTAEFFCIVDKDGWGWTIEGDRPDVDPHHYLRDFLFVRSQEDVLPELPDYIPRDLPLDATPRQRKALDQMFDEWIVELEDGEVVIADTWLARSTRLQQLTSNLGAVPKASGGFFKPDSAKTDALLDLMRQQDVEYPMLVWTWFIETTNIVAERIGKAFKDLRVDYVNGQIPRGQKDERLQAYKDGDLDVLVLQMGVGKFGHTLTDTRTVFYHDRAFDSDAWVQSLRRVRRIGLKHRPVLIVPRIASSADELIDENLEGKLPSIAELTHSDLASLLARIKS